MIDGDWLWMFIGIMKLDSNQSWAQWGSLIKWLVKKAKIDKSELTNTGTELHN